MIIQAVANSFLLEILMGVHQPKDVYRMALYRMDADLSQLTTAYTTQDEVIGSPGYQAGGQALTGYAAKLDGVLALLTWSEALWPKSTITARGALIYNATKQNRAVAVIDLGPSPAGDDRGYSSTNGDFVVTLPPPTAAEALIRIGG